MMYSVTPEFGLRDMVPELIAATSKNAERRKIAFRWFNRLYYDVRAWNKSFMELLDTYPGFSGSTSTSEYEDFIQKVKLYRDSLHERYGTAHDDLSRNLKMLTARYSKDFDWLYKEDEAEYSFIRGLIDDAYASEGNIVDIATVVCDSIPKDPDWHREHHREIVESINDYKNESRTIVAEIRKRTDEVGIHLLDISEYEAILYNEGSANPNVMVIGEVTMSQDKIHIEHVVGPVNVKSRLDQVTQVVKNAPTVSDQQKLELAALIEELKQALEPAAIEQPEDSERVVQAAELVAAEVAKQKPSKSFLAITTEGLKEAAQAVAGIAPPVLSIAANIATVAGSIV